MSKPVTAIASHTHIKGDLRLDGPAVIGGHIQGNLVASDTLEISADAIIDGNIQGLVVIIHGIVKGNVIAGQACQLGASARVAGDLCTADLTIAKGARFIGQLCIGDDMPEAFAPAAPETTKPETKPLPAKPEPAKPAPAIQVVEATIHRVEHESVAAARQEEPALRTSTVSFPTMSTVEVLTQNTPSNLQRAPRIIKAR